MIAAELETMKPKLAEKVKKRLEEISENQKRDFYF
jgi:hypothetical protein